MSRHRNFWWSRQLHGPIAVAAVLRLTLLAVALVRTGTTVIFSGDSASYFEPGRSLLFHGRFVTGSLPEMDRTPGYPLFLALVSLPGMAFAALAQGMLSALTVVLVWRLARTVSGDKRIALIAAWFFTFEPVSVVYSIRLLPETLFLALLLLALERMVAFLVTQKLGSLACAGISLTAATFVRPVSYYLPFALAIGLFAVLMRVPGLRWKAPCVLLIFVLPWLALWQIRNRIETGFSGFSSIVAHNLYFYQAAEVMARIEHKSFIEVQRNFGYPNESSYRTQHPEQAGWSQSQQVAFQQAEAGRILQSHPWTYLKVHFEGSVVVAVTPCAAELLRLLGSYPEDTPNRVVHDGAMQSMLHILVTHPWQASIMVASEAILLGLYLLAMQGVYSGSIRRETVLLLMGVILYFLAVSGGAQAVGRYRLPIMPIVCIFAAIGLHRRKFLEASCNEQ